ncbi:MAG: calcium/sodium antiporter [Lachnospiraceae bacterium]
MSQLMQSLPFAVVLLIVGFVLLVKGADLFVEGSSSVAKRFHVPSIVIGLTIVAMGTSLPETAVSVTASLANNNELAVSNVVGSNIFNLMVVIGFCAVLTPVVVQKETLKKDFPFSVICAILLLALGALGMSLGHLDGAVFLILFAFFIIRMVRTALKEGLKAKDGVAEGEDEIKIMSVPKCILCILLGGVGIALGGDWVVDGASSVATFFGLSQNLIGLTIVSMGTSLPELVTSVVAARKQEVDMALGNAIGSNIFNILMVLGIAAVISPIAFIMENVVDIVILLVFSLLVWVFAWTRKKIDKPEGAIMLLAYFAYLIYIIIR